jgi:hypothetical protein
MFEESDPDVEVWRHHDGTVTAYGASRAGEHWMRLPGVASFHFRADSDVVGAFPEDRAAESLVEDAFRRAVLPMALQVLGREVLHASGVRTPRGIVALCAVAETGKSTVAYGLSRRPGYTLWADDAVAFELRGDGVAALPVPFTLRLRPQSAAYFGGGATVEVVEPEGEPPLAAVCVLERSEEVGVERIASAEAFAAVLTHAYCFTLADPERNRRMMETYLELVTRVPVLRVRLVDGLERLPEALDRIAEAVDPG